MKPLNSFEKEGIEDQVTQLYIAKQRILHTNR